MWIFPFFIVKKIKINIHEVCPRDGLQNEKVALTLEQKKELITCIVGMNPSSIDVTSFGKPPMQKNLITSYCDCYSLLSMAELTNNWTNLLKRTK